MRRQTHEAGEKLIRVWRDETTEMDLELPAWLQPAERAHLCALCDEQGLAHETVEADGNTVLKVLRPAPPLTEGQRERSAANRGAALARRAAARAATAPVAAAAPAAPPIATTAPTASAAPIATAAPTAAAAGSTAATAATAPAAATTAAAASAPPSVQATVDGLSGVADAADQLQLSDSLGVSSALYLSAADMLKLKAMLDAPDDAAHAQRVLRRLSMVPMTVQLDTTTGFLAFLVELSTHETVQAAVQAGAEDAMHATALIARIVSTWEAQLSEEHKQRDAAKAQRRRDANAEAAPRQPRQKDPNCLACQGRHRPHTCK